MLRNVKRIRNGSSIQKEYIGIQFFFLRLLGRAAESLDEALANDIPRESAFDTAQRARATLFAFQQPLPSSLALTLSCWANSR